MTVSSSKAAMVADTWGAAIADAILVGHAAAVAGGKAVRCASDKSSPPGFSSDQSASRYSLNRAVGDGSGDLAQKSTA